MSSRVQIMPPPPSHAPPPPPLITSPLPCATVHRCEDAFALPCADVQWGGDSSPLPCAAVLSGGGMGRDGKGRAGGGGRRGRGPTSLSHPVAGARPGCVHHMAWPADMQSRQGRHRAPPWTSCEP